MVLVDTSIWIDHLRRGDRQLAMLQETGDVVCHPFVIGELACGSLARRHTVLELLYALPRTEQAGHDEILSFIEDRDRYGGGIGLINAQDVRAMGDPDRIRQIVRNLITNALRYGGDDVQVEVIGEEQTGILVCDNGPGIPDQDRERIFQPYRLIHHF